MAFDFIKKVFTFGRKAEEEQAPPASPAPSDQPALAPYIGIADQPAAETPAVEAIEPAPVPETPLQSLPEAEVLPPIREPDPVSADALRAEVAPEPSALPTPEARAAEPPESVPVAEPAPMPPAVEVVEEAAPEFANAPPVEDILPPIRVPDPVPSQPLAAEIAPEPVQPVAPPAAEPVPAPAPAPAGKVTVTKKVEAKAEPVAPAAPAPRASWFQRMREGLARSSRELSSSIAGVFTKKKLDEETLQDLEEVLIRADLGVETALRITDTLSATRLGRDVSDTEVRTVMAQEIEKVLKPVALPLELDLSHKPHVILVVGVNGTGKTTTIGKLSAKLTAGGLKVMLAAGDTFRAAAIEQLKIWGERTNSPVIATKLGADAAGLAYDAFARAKEAGSDVLIIDTAGRLQNSAELMAELEKIVRVLGRLDPDAPHTVLQTVDATTGQNALNQVEIFRNVAGVNGLVMTKLDGTARGGILVAIAAKHKLPVYFIGVGEQVDDLEPFSANEFARAIAGV
ncbi:MAG: signal recognition particle-docking protein FtsY [Pseudomonadota bacterium]